MKLLCLFIPLYLSGAEALTVFPQPREMRVTGKAFVLRPRFRETVADANGSRESPMLSPNFWERLPASLRFKTGHGGRIPS